MTKPLNPNYNPGVGRLVTDRYAFQKHLEGINDAPTGRNYRHTADQIDLTSPLVINGNPSVTTVEQALITISEDLNIIVPVATSSVAGIIKLNGDLAGFNTSYSTPRVGAIQSIPVSSTPPIINQVLTFDGSQWIPHTPIIATPSVIYTTTSVVSSPHNMISSDPTILLEIDAFTSHPMVINLPAVSSVPAGRYYIVKDNTGIPVGSSFSSVSHITINANGADTFNNNLSDFIIYDGYHAVQFVSDGYSNWQVLEYNKATYADSDILSFNSGGTININKFGNLSINSEGNFYVNSGGVFNLTSSPLDISTGSGITINSGGNFIASTGSTTQMDIDLGYINVENTASLNVNSSGTLEIGSGGNFNVDIGSTTQMNVNNDGYIDINTGGALNITYDGYLNIETGGYLVIDGLLHTHSGGIINIGMDGTDGYMNIGATGLLTVFEGGTLNIGYLTYPGYLNVSSAGIITVNQGTINIENSGALNITNLAAINIGNNGTINVNDNGAIEVSGGGIIIIAGSASGLELNGASQIIVANDASNCSLKIWDNGILSVGGSVPTGLLLIDSPSTSPGFNHGDSGLTLNGSSNDFVQYGKAHSREIWNTFTVINDGTRLAATNGYFINGNYWSTVQDLSPESPSNSDGFAITTIWDLLISPPNLSAPAQYRIPFYFKIDNLHNGATLNSLTVSISIVAHPHTPDILPVVQVFRVNNSSTTGPNTAVQLASTGGTFSAYVNSAVTSYFTLNFTGSGSPADNLINTGQYSYYGVIYDESNNSNDYALPGNRYNGYKVQYTNITSDQFP